MQPPFDLDKAHRWFGVSLNNSSWDVLEQAPGPAESVEDVLHAAHASVHHWLQIGTPVNRLRGLTLLAAVYARAGIPERAVHYGRLCACLGEEFSDPQHAFDRAAALGAAAHAHLCAGDRDQARTLYASASDACGAVEAEDDRAVFHRFFPPTGIQD